MRNNPNRNRNQGQQRPVITFDRPFRSVWITTGADSEMNDFAEEAGRKMKDGGLTNAKIRSIYGEIKRIQMSGFSKNRSSFFLLKPKVAYAYGREKNNRDSEAGLRIFKDIFNQAFEHVTDDQSFNNFCNLMEALIAYHRAFGGK